MSVLEVVLVSSMSCWCIMSTLIIFMDNRKEKPRKRRKKNVVSISENDAVSISYGAGLPVLSGEGGKENEEAIYICTYER